MRPAHKRVTKTQKEIEKICRAVVNKDLEERQDAIVQDAAYQALGVAFRVLARDYGFGRRRLAKLKDLIEAAFKLMQIGVLGKEYNAHHVLNYLKETYGIDFSESQYTKKEGG
jgi:NMD protein affecting ribosome stability and mRNA decay